MIGTGKTSFVRTILADMMASCGSEQAQVMIIDTKHVDYHVFNGVDHMLCPVETSTANPLQVFEWLTAEIQRRFLILANKGVKSIRMLKEDEKKSLPDIFCIVDDLSTLKHENAILPLMMQVLRNGRITGIHLITVMSPMPGGSWQKQVISYFPSRVVFHVGNRNESVRLLNQTGAERLMSPGYVMLCHNDSVEYCLAAYKDDMAVEAAIHGLPHSDPVKNVLAVCHRSMPDAAAPSSFAGYEYRVNHTDELSDKRILERAIWMAVQDGQVSTSMLQRRLDIGYARAGRLIDEMERLGIIAAKDGAKPRMTLLTYDEYRKMMGNEDTTRNQQSSTRE